MTATWFRVFPDAEAVARAAVDRIEILAAAALAQRGRFTCVLAGGTTPARVYQLLAARSLATTQWQLYLGDERCLPPEHPERNSVLVAHSGLLRHGARFYPIPAELGSVAGAAAYQPHVASALPFDLVLLGLGEDGHTASLFPGHVWPETATVCAVHQAPKWPPERVSLTPGALSRAAQVLFLATGASKAPAVAAWYQGQSLPVTAITPANAPEVYLDAAAWAASCPEPAPAHRRYSREPNHA